jgi:hypothetical protein
MFLSSLCWSLHPSPSRITINLHLVSTETLIRAASLKQSQLLHPNSKQGEFYIYRECQKILDPFHPRKDGFVKIRFTKFVQKNRVPKPISFDMPFGARFWFSIGHIFYPIELKFFGGLLLCAPCWEKNIKRAKARKKFWIKKKKNSKREENR